MKMRYILDFDLKKDVEFICDTKYNTVLNLFEIRNLLNLQDKKIEEFEQIMKKHNIIGLTKLDACLADYLNVESDTLGGKIIKQQREKIKELTEQNKKLKEDLIYEKNFWNENNKKNHYLYKKLENKNCQLQQSQNQKAIECLEKVKEYCEHWKLYSEYFNYVLTEETSGIRTVQTLYECIDNQIAELKK